MNNNISGIVIDYVESKDISSTRKALSRISYSDHPSDFERFKASYEYAKSELGAELFESYNNEVPTIYIPGKKLSVEDYKKSVSNLMDNFSENRVIDVLETGEEVFKPKKPIPPHKPKQPQLSKQAKLIIGVTIVGVGVIIAAILIKNR